MYTFHCSSAPCSS